MNATRKPWGRLALAVVLTLLALLGAACLGMSAEEMAHEALTDSQWYPNAVYGFYSWVLIVILLAEAALAGWLVFARALRGKPLWQAPQVSRRALCVSCLVLAVLAGVFVSLTRQAYTQMLAARAAGAEGLAGFVQRFGEGRILSLVMVELWLGSLARLLRLRRRKR